MKAIDMLKGRNALISEIEILKSEKIILQELLNSGNYEEYEISQQNNQNYINDGLTFSPVEKIFFRQMKDNTLKISDIKNRLKKIESVINYKNHLLTIINNTLKIIKVNDRYLLESYYFEHMNWKDIVVNYNKKYNKYYVTENGLRRNRHEALKKINNMIKNTIIWEINEL